MYRHVRFCDFAFTLHIYKQPENTKSNYPLQLYLYTSLVNQTTILLQQVLLTCICCKILKHIVSSHCLTLMEYCVMNSMCSGKTTHVNPS